MSDSKGAMALIQHFPRSNWLPYACITTSIFFIIAHCGLMSFDIHVQMDIDMIITSMHYNADIKEYSILTGIIRMVQPDESGHSYILIAVLLFLWSGVWPHLKLFLLYRALTTEFTTDERGRRLQFLGALGKFSLLDVFLVVLIVSALQFTHLGGPNNYAVGMAREGVYVFCTGVFISQVLSAYILRLHSELSVEQLTTKGDDTEEPISLIDHNQSTAAWTIALAIVAVAGFFPAMFMIAYTEHTIVHMAPILNIDQTTDFSLWDAAIRCYNSPANQFWHPVLALCALVLAFVVPFVHMISVLVVCSVRLTKRQLVEWSTNVEIVAEWSAIDVFYLALIPVCLEIGPMTENLAHGKVTNDLDLHLGTLTIALLAVVVAHAAHYMFVKGCHDRLSLSDAVESAPLLRGAEVKT